LPQANTLLIEADALYISHTKQLAALTTRHAMPAIHAARDFVVAGGLMSYGNSPAESYRQAEIQAGDNYDFDRQNSLFLRKNSLFRENNSLSIE